MGKSNQKKISIRIFSSIFIVLIALFLLAYVLIFIIVPKSQKSIVTEEFNNDLKTLKSKISFEGDIFENNDFDQLENEITEFCKNHNIIFSLVDANTNSIMIEWGNDALNEYYASHQGLSSYILINSSVTRTSLSASTSNPNIYIECEFYGQDTDIVIKSLTNSILTILIIIFVTAMIAALICSRVISKPVIYISNVSNAMAALDFTKKCETNRNDEIGTLAKNLNIMSENLDKTIKQLNQANKKLKDDYEFEVKRQKQQKDLFVAISHELKTPITLLKNYIEGMIYNIGKYSDRDRYLKHANDITDALQSLVSEILDVTKLEDASNSLHIENVNIEAIINSCCLMYEDLAISKDINFKHADIEQTYCMADKVLIKKAISNIINNAITHSPCNENVEVMLKENILTVINTGTKINGEDIKDIFLPFYRTDKSRNRSTGGHGIGLYIVSTILSKHDFQYSIKNTDNGVCFIIKF